MTQFVLLIATLIAFAILIIFLLFRSSDEETLYLNYEKNLSLLSGPERAFIKTLEPILSNNYRIFSKVRLADIIDIQHKTGHNIPVETLTKIKATTVSFVICNVRDLSIVGIIDIEDKDRIGDAEDMPDDFIDRAAMEAGLPMAWVMPKLQYDTDEIAITFANYVVSPEQVTKANENKYGNCPSCNEPLMLLKAKHGENIGKYFLGCTNYPECKYLTPINENKTEQNINITPPNDESETNQPNEDSA